MPILTGKFVDVDKLQVESTAFTTNTPLNHLWYSVEEIPDYPDVDELGKIAVMYYHPSNGKFTFEIVDRELTPDEEKELEIRRIQSLLDDAVSLLRENGVL